MYCVRVLLFSIAFHALALSGCSGLDKDKGPSGPTSGNQPNAGVVAGPGGGTGAVVDGGIETAQGDASGSEQGAGGVGGTATNGNAGGGSPINDAGLRESGAAGIQADSAVAKADASGVANEAGIQPPLSTGSCREEHLEPGCLDPETQACVCELLPDCCTVTWDAPCVLIVTQRFCEPEIRACVCGPVAEGGCEMADCCDTIWSDFCETVAKERCVDKESCF